MTVLANRYTIRKREIAGLFAYWERAGYRPNKDCTIWERDGVSYDLSPKPGTKTTLIVSEWHEIAQPDRCDDCRRPRDLDPTRGGCRCIVAVGVVQR